MPGFRSSLLSGSGFLIPPPRAHAWVQILVVVRVGIPDPAAGPALVEVVAAAAEAEAAEVHRSDRQRRLCGHRCPQRATGSGATESRQHHGENGRKGGTCAS